MSKKTALIENLKIVLADSYALYVKTQNYHWNVTGPQFAALHLLFEGQYQELSDAVDLLAEHIRALGSKVPTSFSVFSKMSTLAEGDENADSVTMLKNLAADQLLVIKTINTAIDASKELNDESTLNLLADRLTAHEKNHWMLSASL